MFQGSEHVSKTEHGMYVDAAGGRWNATTSKDRTNYYETLGSHYLDLGLWLEADRMRSLKLTGANFENQRQTVIEEKKQSYDNQPYGLADLRFDELAYSNWAYAHPIIGSVSDLEKATLEDAREFHERYYGPRNATLVLAGDFDGDGALSRISRYFGWGDGMDIVAQPDLSEPPQTNSRLETVKDPLAVLPAVYAGYHMPEAGTPDHYALSMLAVILSHGQSSRLYRELIYENNWITSLSAGPNQYKGPQLFMLWLQVQEGVDPQRVLDCVEGHLSRLCSERVSERELEKAQNHVYYRFVSSRNTITGVAEILAKYAVLYGDPKLINGEAERYLQVNPEDILQAAKRTFRPENQNLIMVEPGR
jgi:predicted Zn-dependent peptidase